MKKLLLAATLLVTVAIGCRKIEEDGQIVIIENPGGGGPSTGQTITIEGRINSDTTLREGNTYILKGLVYVMKGATLTIQPGVTIKAAYTGNDVATLIVTRGGKINAAGTVDKPIVFTSGAPTPKSGDWGGIVICGTAGINTTFNGVAGLLEVEGGINNSDGLGLAGSGDAAFPTANDNDNSGILQYVRIEYAGYAFQPDKEINSLTMAAVGRATTIDHVQVSYSKDDAFEWFGGTVNAKYIIAYKTQDDDFDTDNGFSGSVQFGLIVRDSAIADISKSESFESDNNSGGTTATPKTRPVFSNVTSIGPRATMTNVGNSLYLAAAQLRRNTSTSIYNSVFLGWPIGLLIDASTGTPVDKNIEDSTLRFRHNIIAGCNTPIKYTASGSAPTGATDASITNTLTNSFFKNTILTTQTEANNLFTRPFDYANYDFAPFANSGNQITKDYGFTDTQLAAAMTANANAPNRITAVTFRGAIAPSGADANWHKGWTKF